MFGLAKKLDCRTCQLSENEEKHVGSRDGLLVAHNKDPSTIGN